MINEEEYLPKLHREILVVLDEVVRICKKNNLKYYLTGGTLLGAVRHKGFIPWDDDLDIVMPRNDFKRFTEVCYKELSEDFSLSWFSTEKNYNHIFAKVYNNQTLFEEEKSRTTVSERGIFVDIFPIDISRGYSKNVLYRKKIVNQINKLISMKSYEEEFHGVKKLFLRCLRSSTLNRLAERLMKLFSRNGKYYSNFGSQYNIRKQTHPILNYGSGITLPFEDREYICPQKYKAILRSIYGPDYMKLPPLDKRRSHYPIRVVFSDGQEIKFGITENKIKVEKD